MNFGAGFRVLPTDWLALHIDVQDLVFKSDIIGVYQLKNNLQATIGVTRVLLAHARQHARRLSHMIRIGI